MHADDHDDVGADDYDRLPAADAMSGSVQVCLERERRILDA